MSNDLQKVVIDSRYRKKGTFSNFQVEMPNRGLCGEYELKAFNLYNSFTNINNNNNAFIVTANSITGTIAISTGSYTIIQLANELKLQLGILTGLVWSVTFSSITFKMTFSTSQPFTFNFVTPYTIGFDLGFDNNTSYVSAGNVLASIKQVGLSTLPMAYYVKLKEANDESTLLNASSTTFVIPIITTLNQLNYYEPPINFRQKCSFSNETKYLNVSIYDQNNRLIDFQNDFYFVLEKVC